MKEELTREELKRFIFFAKDKDTRKLATALLEEMDKPKVWDGAPDNALQAQIIWFTKNGGYIGMKTYTREIPKTRARQMAEEVTALVNRAIEGISVEEVEAVLNKYAAELGTTT